MALRARLVGTNEQFGKVRVDDFSSLLNSVLKCLRRSESILSGSPPQLRYCVSDLKASSAEISIAGADQQYCGVDVNDVTAFVATTVKSIQDGAGIDDRIGHSDLETFRELAKAILRGSASELWLGNGRLYSITSQFVANIDKLLDTTPRSYGCVTGVLERLNLHDKREFSLYPAVGGVSILCTFPEEIWAHVHDGTRRTVTVFGEQFFDPGKSHPTRVRVERIDIHPDEDELPGKDELFGILSPDAMNGMSSVDFVNSLRDE
jgi:hypothetical protein